MSEAELRLTQGLRTLLHAGPISIYGLVVHVRASAGTMAWRNTFLWSAGASAPATGASLQTACATGCCKCGRFAAPRMPIRYIKQLGNITLEAQTIMSE